MPQLSISEVAKQFGLRPSALRYYEEIGILPRTGRESGQRRYDSAMLRRLAVVQRARQVGFSLEEIRHLFFGFQKGTMASARWHELSERKLAQLEASIEQIRTMQNLLQKMSHCRCSALDECGESLLRKMCRNEVQVRSP